MPIAADAPGRLDPSTHRVSWCCSGPCGSQDRFHCSRVSIRRGGESVPWLLSGLQAKPRSCSCPSASCCQAWKIVSGTECLTIIWSAEISFTSIVPNAAKSMIYGGEKNTFSPARETSCIQVSCLICHPRASHAPSLHGFVRWMGQEPPSWLSTVPSGDWWPQGIPARGVQCWELCRLPKALSCPALENVAVPT